MKSVNNNADLRFLIASIEITFIFATLLKLLCYFIIQLILIFIKVET